MTIPNESGRVVEFVHPALGRLRVLGQLVRLSETPGIIRGPSPLLGEHTDLILRDLGYTPEAIARLKQRGVIASAAR